MSFMSIVSWVFICFIRFRKMKSFNSLILNAKKFLNDQNYRVLEVKSDERQEGMVARTAYRLNQSMGIAEQMVNMIRAWQSVPYLNPPASDYFS